MAFADGNSSRAQDSNFALTGYVPPHSRRADGTSSATSLSLGHDANGLAGKLGKLSGQRLPPGAAPPDTKSASKNSKRRSKKKAAGAEADVDGGDGVHAVPSKDNASANGETNPDCSFCFVSLPWQPADIAFACTSSSGHSGE